MHQAFLSPRLIGKRFDEHTVPLEILKDFAALEEMLIEVAKWKFRQAYPDSLRVQRNFSKGLELHLLQVEEGSAIPAIVLMCTGLVPVANAQYLEQARTEIVVAIQQAQQGKTPNLPADLMSYFDRFGRGLRDGEAIEFRNENQTLITYTPADRKRLIKLSKAESWTEEMALRGRIPSIAQDKLSFQIELSDGVKLTAPLTEQHWSTVLAAVNGYRAGTYMLFQGVVKKDRQDHLQAFEFIEHISHLDPLDVTLRLEALAKLKQGWLDGKGHAPTIEQLQWLIVAFEDNFDNDLLLPYLYPTAEGGVQAEWSIGDWETTLEIDLLNQMGDLQALNLATDESHEYKLALKERDGWTQLNTVLHQIGGAA